MNDWLVVCLTLITVLLIIWLTKSRPKKKNNALISDIRTTFKPQWGVAVDQSRANLLFMKHGKPELMNKGYDLAAAKELINNG